MHTMGKTFIVSGPSGVGKSTVLHALFEGRDDLYFSVSATTRTPREGERDGVDYHFIHADRFRNMPSWKELERRLTARGTDSPEKVQKRLLRAQVELEMARDYDYFVVNDTVENAVNELRAIMCAEHCKPAERIDSVLNSK